LFLTDGTFAGSLEHGTAEQIAAHMTTLTSRTHALAGVAA
ncbi:ABC transporter ATP-binding protein, partial [Streptomyces sp. NPDC005786]